MAAPELPRPVRVKNKEPAPIQITAEHILREAREHQEPEIRPPKQKIADPDELAQHRLRKRKEFEGLLRRARRNVSVWVRYALWEESQGDFPRARSVWERALLDVDYRDHTLWLKYAEYETRNGFISYARNVWDRAVSLLPRVDQLWYKYLHMEETLENVPAARQVFERWMQWRPDAQGWLCYVDFELRYGEADRARAVFERFTACHPRPDAFIRYGKFEMKLGEVARARAVYERAIDLLSNHEDEDEDEDTEKLFMAFADFEETCQNIESARCVYKYALQQLPPGRAEELHRKFVSFEKRYGDHEGAEAAIVGKNSFKYEEEVQKNPLNYDSWFDYIRLEESRGNEDMIREVYKRATANVPPSTEKRYWRRYIYIWINYALYEELDAQDMEKARAVYRECLKVIPHKKFSFAKIWFMAAQFEIRQMNLKAARQIFGNAIGMAPKGKIFRKYIEIEEQIGNINRCRTLYAKYLDWDPANYCAWIKYAELERSLSETERARAVFELAIAQPVLDMPELLWKAYFDFEISESEHERARQLYERLLGRTRHLKVWLSFANFEASAGLGGKDADGQAKSENHSSSSHAQQAERVRRCRAVFEMAFNYFRTSAPELKEETAMLLEDWRRIEGSIGDVNIVQNKLPRKVKRKRAILTEDGTPSGIEEYYDYQFPDEVATANVKMLDSANRWKRQKSELNVG